MPNSKERVRVANIPTLVSAKKLVSSSNLLDSTKFYRGFL